MKKLVNDPRRVVREMLEGVCDLHPGLALLADFDVVVRADLPPPERRAVAVISGGGSGHEPAHAGYVGPGLLAAAIAGDVFTSPSVDAVLAGIRAAAGPAGALLVVKNYTGDRLNFGLAAELARARGHSGRDRRRGRRRGAAQHRAARSPARHRGHGADPQDGRRRRGLRAWASPRWRLSPAPPPAISAPWAWRWAPARCRPSAVPASTLGATEIELGLGIHGEQGIERDGPAAGRCRGRASARIDPRRSRTAGTARAWRCW